MVCEMYSIDYVCYAKDSFLRTKNGHLRHLFPLLISIAGLGFGFGLGHRFLYYADTMGKRSESESESVETCSA